MKIEVSDLKEMEQSGIEIRKDRYGNSIGYKGPWLPDWYDNYTEMLRENQKARRIALNTEAGLNEHAQTKEQADAFKKRQKLAEDRKRKAELAAEMAFQNK